MTLPADTSELDTALFPTDDLNNDFDDDNFNGSFIWAIQTLEVRMNCQENSLLMPQHVLLLSKIDQLSHLESTTVSRAPPLCVLCMS